MEISGRQGGHLSERTHKWNFHILSDKIFSRAFGARQTIWRKKSKIKWNLDT